MKCIYCGVLMVERKYLWGFEWDCEPCNKRYYFSVNNRLNPTAIINLDWIRRKEAGNDGQVK